MKNSISLIPILFFCGPLLAQTAPTYQVRFQTCLGPNPPVEVKTHESDWILVNKGADKVKLTECTARVAEFAAANPKESDVRFKDIRSVPSPLKRGIGKSDIYCKFESTGPVAIESENEACGISHIERHGSVDSITLDSAKGCLKLPASTQTELWTKLACVTDARDHAVQISDMDKTTADSLDLQVDLISRALSRGLGISADRVQDIGQAQQK